MVVNMNKITQANVEAVFRCLAYCATIYYCIQAKCACILNSLAVTVQTQGDNTPNIGIHALLLL